jgi:hypothetical protein
MDSPVSALEVARRDVGLSMTELWMRYFELGGMSPPLELEAMLHGALLPNAHDGDVITVALSERFSELGRDHPVPSSDDAIGRPRRTVSYEAVVDPELVEEQPALGVQTGVPHPEHPRQQTPGPPTRPMTSTLACPRQDSNLWPTA